MKILGDWNWYLPSWLEWIPHVGSGADPREPEPGFEPADKPSGKPAAA
jgi:hypothetical protein